MTTDASETKDEALSAETVASRDPVDRLLQVLNYEFNDKKLLLEALTHRSYVNETSDMSVCDNERLEFLGDAVIDIVVSTQLMKRFSHAREGTMSRIRASMVNESGLAAVARSIDLGSALRLGRGEDLSGGRSRSSLLADAYEAVIAAAYLDGGLETVERILENHLQYPDQLDLSVFDAKTYLQEKIQAQSHVTPHYQVLSEEGPDHDKTFTVAVICGAETLSQGVGRTKKDAEQDAASKALSALQAESS
jgi:ribonuclease III